MGATLPYAPRGVTRLPAGGGGSGGAGTETQRMPWWREGKGNPGNQPEVVRIVKTLVESNGNLRRLQLLQWYRLYNNTQAKGLLAGNYFRPSVTGRQNRLSYNLVASAIDTIVARLTTQQPTATCSTSGGTWSDQTKAKLLDRFIDGLFYETDFHTTAADILRDAAIFGVGIAKVYEGEDGKVCVDRVFAEELIVDEIEAVYGTPRSIYQTRLISRDVLMEMFKDKDQQKLIKDAPTARLDAQQQLFAEQANLVMVLEAWHLPSAPPPKYTKAEQAELQDLRDQLAVAQRKALDEGEPMPPTSGKLVEKIAAIEMKGHDGRHGIYLENGCLFFASWRKTYFPFAVTHWTKPTRGYLNGSGIAEALVGIQYEINKILIMMSECIYWSIPKLMVNSAAKVVQAHLDDIAGGVLKWTGASEVYQPKLVTWNAIPEQLFRQFDRLVSQGLAMVGISQMAAMGKKPSGLSSGAAIRDFDDVGDERFGPQGTRFEKLHVDVARLAIRVAREIADRNGGSYPVRAPVRRRFVREIDWKDIDLDDKDFVIRVFPVSSLPRTPAGRLDMVADLMNLGYVSKEDGLRLLNFQDLEAVSEIMEASAEFTNYQIEKMLEDGDPMHPQPQQNLAYALAHVQGAFLLAQTMDVDPRRLVLVQNYMDEAKLMIQKTQQPPLPPGQQPGIPGPPGQVAPVQAPPLAAAPAA